MFRVKQVVLWLPALLLLHGAVAEVYAKKCSLKTVKAAFDSEMSVNMVASICPKYKETIAKSGGEISAQPASSSASKSSQMVQAASASSSRAVKNSCSDQDKANMVLAGVKLEVIWKMCGKPAQTAQTVQAAAVVQPTATVANESAPESKPKQTRSRRSQSKEETEAAKQEEKSEPVESESEQSTLEMQHTLGFGLGLGAQTQYLLPYYFYNLDEQLMVGAQLRMMKMDGSSVTAITGSGGYLWKWSDFRLGGQGYLGFGGGVSWGFEGLAFYDLVPGLDLGLALNLPLGSTKDVSHKLGFTMLAGYKF